jgi:hypothetical protein
LDHQLVQDQAERLALESSDAMRLCSDIENDRALFAKVHAPDVSRETLQKDDAVDHAFHALSPCV